MSTTEARSETAGTAAAAAPQRSRGPAGLTAQLGRYGIPVFLVAVTAFFSVLKPSSFGTLDNYRAILDQQTVVALLALAITVPLVVGEFDLSVGAVASLVNVFIIGLAVKQGIPGGLAIVVSLLGAALIGLINGLIVVRLRVSAFVATLGMGTVLAGVWLWYLDGEVIVEPRPGSFTDIARADLLTLSRPVFYVAAITLVLWFVFSYLPLGRRMYAAGGNRQAARLTGIRTDRLVVGSFVVSALLSGVAGVVLGTRLATASPGSAVDLLLPGFAAAFLGATTIRPGRFNVLGTVVSVYALAVMISGLEQLGAKPYVEPLFNGGALIAAVALSGWAFRSKAERARKEQLRRIRAESASGSKGGA